MFRIRYLVVSMIKNTRARLNDKRSKRSRSPPPARRATSPVDDKPTKTKLHSPNLDRASTSASAKALGTNFPPRPKP